MNRAGRVFTSVIGTVGRIFPAGGAGWAKQTLISAGVLLFSAALLAGGALIISHALAYKAAAEEGKIISDQAVTLASGTAAKDAADKTGHPQYTIVDSGKAEAVDEPAAKDISKEQAASYAAGKIKQLFGDNLNGGRVDVRFSKSASTVILKDVWLLYFYTADERKEYICSIDSVTGEVYEITLHDKSQEPLFAALNAMPEGMTAEQKQAWQDKESEQLAAQQSIQEKAIHNDDHLFLAAARDIVNADLLNGRTVVAAKFAYFGGLEGGRSLMDVAVSMSDGSDYVVELDEYTRELVGFRTFPDGLQTWFTRNGLSMS